jgi:hypothetical protein
MAPWCPVVARARAASGVTPETGVLAHRSRLAYGVPMAIGLVGALIAILLLLTGSLL